MIRRLRRQRRRAEHAPAGIDLDDIDADPYVTLPPTVSNGFSIDTSEGKRFFNPLGTASDILSKPFPVDDRHAEDVNGDPVGMHQRLRYEDAFLDLASAQEAAAFEEFEQRVRSAVVTANRLAGLLVANNDDEVDDEEHRDRERERHRALNVHLSWPKPTAFYLLSRNLQAKIVFFFADMALAAVLLKEVFNGDDLLAILGGGSVALGTVIVGTNSGDELKQAWSKEKLGPADKDTPQDARALHLPPVSTGAQSTPSKKFLLSPIQRLLWLLPVFQGGTVTALLGALGTGGGVGAAESFGAGGLLGLTTVGAFALGFAGREPKLEAIEQSQVSLDAAEKAVAGHRRLRSETHAAVAELTAALHHQLVAAEAAWKAVLAVGKVGAAMHLPSSLASYFTLAPVVPPARQHPAAGPIEVPKVPERKRRRSRFDTGTNSTHPDPAPPKPDREGRP